jgi:hypothetical protein
MSGLEVRHVQPSSLEPDWEPDKSGSGGLTQDKAEKLDISEKTLWCPDKELEKVGWDLAAKELGLGRICLVQELGMSS